MGITARLEALPKTVTGIQGLDEITYGGLPKGRPTLLVGGAGSGKTMLAMEFLVRGATEFGEPGVFASFEETAKDLAANFASRGFDLDELIAEKKLYIDHVHIERSEIEETGEYDLEGLFIRLAHAVKVTGAKRVVLDTIEALFAGLTNTAILRAELRRLFAWLKERDLTAIITGERGENTLTRYGLEEYVADCVIVLDNRVVDQISTRRLRIMKYRGSQHGTNEYPFLIENTGITVLFILSGTFTTMPLFLCSKVVFLIILPDPLSIMRCPCYSARLPNTTTLITWAPPSSLREEWVRLPTSTRIPHGGT